MQYLRTTLLLGTLALATAPSVAACGGGTPEASEPSAARDEAPRRWTAALLRKLDAALRAKVRDGVDDRMAVKVHFQRIPEDEELANLLLSRVGGQVVGQVEPSVLRAIAARDDVDRIEHLSDVGY
jgi:hypothetical protein